jgi:hypothetical protein
MRRRHHGLDLPVGLYSYMSTDLLSALPIEPVRDYICIDLEQASTYINCILEFNAEALTVASYT